MKDALLYDSIYCIKQVSTFWLLFMVWIGRNKFLIKISSALQTCGLLIKSYVWNQLIIGNLPPQSARGAVAVMTGAKIPSK